MLPRNINSTTTHGDSREAIIYAHHVSSESNSEWLELDQLLRVASRERNAFIGAGIKRGWEWLAGAAHRALNTHGAPHTA